MPPISAQRPYSLAPVKTLSSVFPDVEDELCSRHSILFGKLRTTFNKTYDGLDPDHYIVVKGVLDISKNEESCLSMALYNGVILLLKAIDPEASIYVNSNHFGEELILSHSGELQYGLHPYTRDITSVIEAANAGLPTNTLLGGIVYMHFNIPEDYFQYREALLISLYVGISQLNGQLTGVTLDQVIDRIAKCKFIADRETIAKYFDYHNRQFSLQMGGDEYSLNLYSKYKLVLCQLDLAKADIRFERERRYYLYQRKRYVLSLCNRQKGFTNLWEIYTAENMETLSFDYSADICQSEDLLQSKNFLEMSLKYLSLLDSLSMNSITFQQYVSAQWEVNSKYWKVHSDEVVELVEEIKDTLKLNSCMMVNETFILIVTEKAKYTELLIYLRQKLHKGELKSKSLFKIEEYLVETRWGSDKIVGEKMFTSVPSEGISVYNPSGAIWFD